MNQPEVVVVLLQQRDQLLVDNLRGNLVIVAVDYIFIGQFGELRNELGGYFVRQILLGE